MRAWAWAGRDRRDASTASRRAIQRLGPRRAPPSSGARRDVAEGSVTARDGAAVLVCDLGGTIGNGATTADPAAGRGQHIADLCLTQELDRQRKRDRRQQLVRSLREADRGARGGVDQRGERAAMRDIEPVQVLVLDDELHLAKIGVTLGEAIAKELGIAAGRLLPIDVVHA